MVVVVEITITTVVVVVEICLLVDVAEEIAAVVRHPVSPQITWDLVVKL